MSCGGGAWWSFLCHGVDDEQGGVFYFWFLGSGTLGVVRALAEFHGGRGQRVYCRADGGVVWWLYCAAYFCIHFHVVVEARMRGIGGWVEFERLSLVSWTCSWYVHLSWLVIISILHIFTSITTDHHHHGSFFVFEQYSAAAGSSLLLCGRIWNHCNLSTPHQIPCTIPYQFGSKKEITRTAERDEPLNEFKWPTESIYRYFFLHCRLVGLRMLLNVLTKGSIGACETMGVSFAQSHFGLEPALADLIVFVTGCVSVSPVGEVFVTVRRSLSYSYCVFLIYLTNILLQCKTKDHCYTTNRFNAFNTIQYKYKHLLIDKP